MFNISVSLPILGVCNNYCYFLQETMKVDEWCWIKRLQLVILFCTIWKAINFC